MSQKLLKPEEVQQMLGISQATLYAWSHRKVNLQPRRIGRLLRYLKKDVDDFINKKGGF